MLHKLFCLPLPIGFVFHLPTNQFSQNTGLYLIFEQWIQLFLFFVFFINAMKKAKKIFIFDAGLKK